MEDKLPSINVDLGRELRYKYKIKCRHCKKWFIPNHEARRYCEICRNL